VARYAVLSDVAALLLPAWSGKEAGTANLGLLVCAQPARALAWQHIWVAGALIQPQASVCETTGARVVGRVANAELEVGAGVRRLSLARHDNIMAINCAVPLGRSLHVAVAVLLALVCMSLFICAACIGLLSRNCLL